MYYVHLFVDPEVSIVFDGDSPSNKCVALSRLLCLCLRVDFSKDQTHWKMDDSDLDKIRTTRAVGHNSG